MSGHIVECLVKCCKGEKRTRCCSKTGKTTIMGLGFHEIFHFVGDGGGGGGKRKN